MLNIFDTVKLNSSAGGVLQFTERLTAGIMASHVHARSVLNDLDRRSSYFRKVKSRFLVDELYSTIFVKDDDRSIFTNYYLPVSLSKVRSSRSVVVVHDLQFKYLPDLFSTKKLLWLNYSLERAARFSGGIVCISNSTADDFTKFYKRRENVQVIYNPVDLKVANPDSIASEDESYILASYHFYPHKNIEGVFEFFRELKDSGYKGKLVLTGNGKDAVVHLADKYLMKYPNSVEHFGYVSEIELGLLQRKCAGFISLSKFEGFNLPAAECAVHSKHLLLSDIPVHREIYGDTAFLVTSLADASKALEYLRMPINKMSMLNEFNGENVAAQYVGFVNSL